MEEIRGSRTSVSGCRLVRKSYTLCIHAPLRIALATILLPALHHSFLRNSFLRNSFLRTFA